MNKWTPTKAGLYPSMTRAEYDACDAMNQSTLKHGLKSMSALKAAIDKPSESTEAMQLGELIHTCILEPELLDERYYVMPKVDGRTKAGKEKLAKAQKAAGGRRVIQQPDYDLATAICNLLDQTPYARNLLHPDMVHECAAIWKHGDIWCKALIDGYLPGVRIVDIKKTKDASPQDFQRSIARYGYHIQAAFYQDAIWNVTGLHGYDGLLPYYIIALETSDPPQLAVYHMSDEAIDIGRQEYHRLLDEYAACKRHDIWPSYATDIQEIGLPPWVMHGGVLQETF